MKYSTCEEETMSDDTVSEEKVEKEMSNVGLMAIGGVALFASYKLGKLVSRLRGHKSNDDQSEAMQNYMKGWEDAQKGKTGS
jgi:hypothetical protein